MRAYERLLKYVKEATTSDENNVCCPSTKSQMLFADKLVMEMKDIGIEDAYVDENGYVYGTVPATLGYEKKPVIGLIAHMDTAPSFIGENVKPKLVYDYNGGNIELNENVFMDTNMFPELRNYIGKTLIVTDGNTLLGADDKAGIAEIMTAVETIIIDKLKHGKIKIAFTPDEEIGRGADLFNIEKFAASYAYTVDGGALGEIEYENFNAASARVIINGNCIHPGEGKGKMKNAVLMAMKYNSLLPEKETPSHTEGYEGFYHLTDINGSEEKTIMNYIIRDHDWDNFNNRKNKMIEIQNIINELYGEKTCFIEIKDSYYNMKEKILPHMEIVEKAAEAMQKNNIEPKIVPIRGGTDGARLSYMGLPCPNLSTGGHNFHGKYEYIPVESMDKMTDVITSLVTGD